MKTESVSRTWTPFTTTWARCTRGCEPRPSAAPSGRRMAAWCCTTTRTARAWSTSSSASSRCGRFLLPHLNNALLLSISMVRPCLVSSADGGQQAARHRGGGGDHPHQGGLRPRAVPHHGAGRPAQAGRRQPAHAGGRRAQQRCVQRGILFLLLVSHLSPAGRPEVAYISAHPAMYKHGEVVRRS